MRQGEEHLDKSVTYKEELCAVSKGSIISLEKYITSIKPILHRHISCGHEWKARPNDFLQGCGCPSCAIYGFDKTKPAVLYYLKVGGGVAYKIGITNNSVQARFNNTELAKIEIIKILKYSFGEEAYAREQEILKEFSFAKYKGEPLLKSGNSELFYYDILGLDIKLP